MDRKLKSIDTKNPDYYQWGLNCQILGFEQESTLKILRRMDKDIEPGNFDLFWEGYYSKE